MSRDSVRSSRPTAVRWWILAIVMAIMAVTALNRLNLSIAGKYIEEEFSFSTISMGTVFSAFLWGYGLFQIPWGYVCDRMGPRRTLTASIFVFAVGSGAMVFAPRFAAATGISALAVFRIVRFLTGVGEAAVSSNVTRVIASWTAVRERGFASGLQVCGLGLGGTMTPIAIAWTMVHWGWRVSFAISAALAFVVVALWHWYATDWPEENPRVNEQELRTIHPGWETATARPQRVATKVPWLKMFSSVSVWALILGYGFQGYAFYVYYNWFYFYAVKMRGLDLMHAAAWTSAPFLAMAVLSPVGGWFSDRVARVSDRRRGRLVGGVGRHGRRRFVVVHRQPSQPHRGCPAHDCAGSGIYDVRGGEFLGILYRSGARILRFVIRADEHCGEYRGSGLIHCDRLHCGSSRLDAGVGCCRMGHDRVGIAVYDGKRESHYWREREHVAEIRAHPRSRLRGHGGEETCSRFSSHCLRFSLHLS